MIYIYKYIIQSVFIYKYKYTTVTGAEAYLSVSFYLNITSAKMM